MRRDHFFDWEGFKFAAKVLVLCIIAGSVGRYGLLYAAESHSQTPSLVLIQETRPAQKSLSLTLSTTTPEHIINTLSESDAVPSMGKFIAANLSTMVLTLYQDGVAINKYPIRAKGKIGSPYETAAGFYTVLKKESDHFNSAEQVDLPWSVQFYANYFIHGSPYADDGSPVGTSYTGGGIELGTGDAEKVYTFSEKGTDIFVFNQPRTALTSLVLDAIPVPSISAAAYVVVDIDTGDVFLEQNAESSFPIISATRMMIALVAGNAIAFDKKVTLARSVLLPAKTKTTETKDLFYAGDILYPILMTPNDEASKRLIETYGTEGFFDWMNATAKTLGMQSTHFSDTVGTSTENVSTPSDLFRLAAYLAHKKSFVLDITRTSSKDLIADSGNVYHLENTAEKDTTVSIFSVPIGGATRRVAVIVLGSNNSMDDTAALSDWFTQSAQQGADIANTACATCAIPPPYRKIQL